MLSFGVERRARLDVGRHVRDRHDESPASAHFFAVDRIVEVARVLAVDRHERQVAQILTIALRRSADGGAERLSLRDRLTRKLEWQTVRMNRDLSLHPRRRMLAEHAGD